MDSIEDRLREYIKTRYGSVRAFVLTHDLNYANVDSILRRGIKNATWHSVKSLCHALQISADELAKGNIVTVSAPAQLTRIEDIFEQTKQKLHTCSNPTLNDHPVNADTITSIIDGLNLLLEIQKRRIEK